MNEQQRKEAIQYIEGQLENGYIDLGFHDKYELETIKEAISMLKTVDAWNSISEEYCIPTQEIYETDDGDIIYRGYIPDEYGY